MCHFCRGTGYEPVVDESGDIEVVRCECQPDDVSKMLDIVGRLVGEMRDAGVVDPLGATVSLGAVIDDLYRLSGIAVPVGVEAWAGGAL